MKSDFRSFALAALIGVAGLASVQAQALNRGNVTPSVSEVVRLHNSGVSEDSMLAHIRNAAIAQPTADEILYLHEAGVAKAVITAMIQKGQPPQDTEVLLTRSPAGSGRLLAKPEWEQTAYAADASARPHSSESYSSDAPAISEAPVGATTSTPVPVYVQPAPVYVTPPPVVRTYSAPSYYYPSYYDWWGPRFSIGFGFGHGWGHRWHHGHHHWGGRDWHRGHGIHWRGHHHGRR